MVFCGKILPSGRIIVEAKDDIIGLWNLGCYGKGNLSRSQPTWWERFSKIRSLDFVEHVSRNRKSQRKGQNASDAAAKQVEVLRESNEVYPDLEVLCLMPEEAMYLQSRGLCEFVDIENKKLQYKCDLTKYSAYEHFRNLGWIPKSGFKYGTDFLLYKNGPQYEHSEFAVYVQKGENEDEFKVPNSIKFFKVLERVCSHAKKVFLSNFRN